MPLPKGSVKTRTVMSPALGEGLNREILELKTISLPLVKLATSCVGPGMGTDWDGLERVGTRGEGGREDLSNTFHIRCFNPKLQGQLAAVYRVGGSDA